MAHYNDNGGGKIAKNMRRSMYTKGNLKPSGKKTVKKGTKKEK